DGGDVAPDLLDRRGQLGLTASRDEDVGAFVHEPLRRRQADAAAAARHESGFPFELGHVYPLRCQVTKPVPKRITPCRPPGSVRGGRPGGSTTSPPASAPAIAPGPAPTPGGPRAAWPRRRRSGGPASRGGPRRGGRRPNRRRSGGGGCG